MIESSRYEWLGSRVRLCTGSLYSRHKAQFTLHSAFLCGLRSTFRGGNSVPYATKLQCSGRGYRFLAVLLCCFTCGFSAIAFAADDASAASAKRAHATAGSQEPSYPYLAARYYDPTRWGGEEFHFTISMMGGEAARAVLTIGRATEDENLGRVVPVQGLVGSVGLLSALVNFKYGGLTYLNAETGQPIWSEKLLEDSGRSRTYTTFYDRENYQADVTRLENDRSRETQRIIPAHVDDIFSWIFRLRNTELAVGDTYTFYIFDGWLTRRLHAKVISHVERYEDSSRRNVVRAAEIDVTAESLTELFPLPWAQSAADLAPVFTVRSSEQVATTWISLDERRIPLGIELRTPVGFMRVALTRYVPPSR